MITPTAYLKKLEGKSNGHLIRFSDEKDYVVKFFQPGLEKTMPNEWIGYCLARFLGLPVPFARIVNIPPEFAGQVPEIAQESQKQYQFASLFIPGCLDGHQVTDIPHIMNEDTLAGIILLDYWLCNQDRTRKNILLQETGPSGYKLWIIDHAEIFGAYNWLHSDLGHLPVEVFKSATHKMMAKFINDEQSFMEYLELIQTFPVLLIEEIVSVIPDDWLVSKEEKKAIVTALITRRKKVLPELLDKFLKNLSKSEI